MLCPSLQTMALFLCLQTSRSSLKKRGMILQGCLLFIFAQNKLLCLLVWACIQCTMCMRTAMQMVVYTNFFKMPSWAGQPQLITEDDINVHIYLVPIFSLLNPNIQYILGLLQFCCDFLLHELQVHLCEFWDLDVSISTIWWALQNAGLTWKKVLVLPLF